MVEIGPEEQGMERVQDEEGPVAFYDDRPQLRMWLKRGSPQGTVGPHVQLRNASGQRVDPWTGDLVTRKSASNHRPIEWDL